jgi:hypothetical protein
MASPLTSPRHRVDSLDDAFELCFERGWTDGLPVVPPTEEKVLRFIDAVGRKPDELVCRYPSRNRIVTLEKVAINAVMAGCRPEYFPVVLAIIEAMADDAFGLHAINATTGGSAVGFIVNGPVRTQLEMNFRGNVLGPGNRANSTIGRAVRLTQINAMGSVPGAGNEAQIEARGRPILDRATIGQPGKYAGYHIVENEEDYPSLLPLHVERGFAADQSVVTAFATVGHIQISVHAESSAEQIAETLSHYLVGTGRFQRLGYCVLVIPPENANIFVRDGWSKADIRRAIFEGTSRSVAWVKSQGGSLTGGLFDRRGAQPDQGDENETVAIAGSEDEILIVIAGGPAGAFVHALLPYGGMASRVVHCVSTS